MPFTVNMPKLSPTMEEGTIVKWHKKEGELVKAGELLVEVATDKATIEYNALDGGYVRKILIPEGGKAIINEPIALLTEGKDESIEGFKIKEAKSDPKEVLPMKSEEVIIAPTPKSTDRVIASPLAKKIAGQKGIDLSSIQGTGPRGRITSKDLSSNKQTSKMPTGSFEEVSLTPMRKVIATRLQQAKSTIPHIYVRQEINAEPLFLFREQLKSGNVKITFNDLTIKAAALALRDHPEVNSGFNDKNQSILRFKTIDISVAVTIPGGLITPILTHADHKSLSEISTEVKQLATKAKEGKLQPHEYQGGTFTISNLGMFGISDFCAIINPPQAAILAVGGIEEAIRLQNGLAVAGKKMNLVLSADHRAVDGAEAAAFMKTLQKYLENPALLSV